MKEKIKKIFTFFIFPFILLFLTIGSFFNFLKRDKSKKEEYSSRIKENPDIVENQYSDPFQGRDLIVKSINTSASVVSAIDDFFERKF